MRHQLSILRWSGGRQGQGHNWIAPTFVQLQAHENGAATPASDDAIFSFSSCSLTRPMPNLTAPSSQLTPPTWSDILDPLLLEGDATQRSVRKSSPV